MKASSGRSEGRALVWRNSASIWPGIRSAERRDSLFSIARAPRIAYLTNPVRNAMSRAFALRQPHFGFCPDDIHT